MAETNGAAGPLAGIRVIEFAQAMAIPACGLLLGDMGADVIKVEPPQGDAFRHGQEPILPGESKGYTVLNRNKRTICLDVTRPEARPVVEALVRTADIVLISLKPADPPRYGMTYENFAAINPRVIYLDHVPVGSKGPFGGDPGYDVVVQGMSGTAVITGRERGGVPINIRPAYNDMGTGFLSAAGVLAALHHRDLTGEGQRVETSLLSTALTLANQLVSWFAAVDPPREEGFTADVAAARARGAGFEEQREIWEQHYLRGAYGNIYFRHYRTRDGFISVGCLSPVLNARFRKVTGLHDPRQDPGFDLGSPEGYDALTKLIREAEDLLASRTTAEWLGDFRAGGVPCGPLNFPPDVFHDEHILANEFVVELEHEVLGPYKTFGLPVRMDRTPTSIRTSAPPLDAHTDEVLGELGFNPEAIAGLRASGVVGRE